MTNRRQATIWTNADLIHLRIYAALGGDNLRPEHFIVSRKSAGLRQRWTTDFCDTNTEEKCSHILLLTDKLRHIFSQIHCIKHWNRPWLIRFNSFSTGHIWTRQIWGIWKLRPAYSPEMLNLGQNQWCFVPCDLEILWMTLENNRALCCCFKLCATFHSHSWIQTGVTVRKRPIWVKFNDF